MLAYLAGYRPVSFTANDGRPINGVNLYLTFPKEGVVGEMTDKVFIPDGFPLPALEPSITLDISYNRRGRPEAIKIAK